MECRPWQSCLSTRSLSARFLAGVSPPVQRAEVTVRSTFLLVEGIAGLRSEDCELTATPNCGLTAEDCGPTNYCELRTNYGLRTYYGLRTNYKARGVMAVVRSSQ